MGYHDKGFFNSSRKHKHAHGKPASEPAWVKRKMLSTNSSTSLPHGSLRQVAVKPRNSRSESRSF